MKGRSIIALTILTCGLGVSTAQAVCTGTGEIPRVIVTAGNTAATFSVRASTGGGGGYTFSSSDPKVLAAVLSAQASHERVTVVGDAPICPFVVFGTPIPAGTVVSVTIAP